MYVQVDPAGFVLFGEHTLRCALGRGGINETKHEGDGTTPVGAFPLGRVFYRADRLKCPPHTGLTTLPITQNLGWCDDPEHADYNKLIVLPHTARHEKLWRDDHVYDVVVEVLYNTNPVLPHRGSAIFMHVAKSEFTPTEGCIALTLRGVLQLLTFCNKGDLLIVPPPAQCK